MNEKVRNGLAVLYMLIIIAVSFALFMRAASG